MTLVQTSAKKALRVLPPAIIGCVCILVTSCAGGPNYYRPTFVEMARVPRKVKVLDNKGNPVEVLTDARTDRNATLRFSDQIAINYANEMINVLSPKFNRARIAGNASATMQTASSGLVAANAATKLSSQALSWLGVTNLVLPGVQGIFDAKGRSQAYLKAAYEIQSAIIEYQSLNQNPSDQFMTQNGVTLVHRTDAAIHVVESYLAGEMPDPRKVSQMVEPMSTQGAVRTQAGDAAVNNITSSGLKQAVADIPLNPGRSTTDRIVLPPKAYLDRVDSLLGRVNNLNDADAVKAANANLGLALTANDGDKAKTLIYGAIADLRGKEDVKAVEKWEALMPPQSDYQKRVKILFDKAGGLGDAAIAIANKKWPDKPVFTTQLEAIVEIKNALTSLRRANDENELADWEHRLNAPSE